MKESPFPLIYYYIQLKELLMTTINYKRDMLLYFLDSYLSKQDLQMKDLMRNVRKILNNKRKMERYKFQLKSNMTNYHIYSGKLINLVINKDLQKELLYYIYNIIIINLYKKLNFYLFLLS